MREQTMTLSGETLADVPEVIRRYNITRTLTVTTPLYSPSVITQTAIPMPSIPDISPIVALGFALLILTTVIGNTLVLGALFLDKRLHTPSFFLIANMAIADLLLGLFVLPLSSLQELLNDRWVLGQSLCTTWLAVDVLCCTASIIALMAVSIDRYIGVTRPLTYSGIMTTRRTIYLIILVWTVSILTSVVPLFGLTDRGSFYKSTGGSVSCKVNKNTFYTIFSSLISFYIPVIILLILYSRVYQEANRQGKILEQEKRRIYEIDYQLAAEQARRQQSQPNGHAIKTRSTSNQSDDKRHETTSRLLPHDGTLDEECSLDQAFTSVDSVKLKHDYVNDKADKHTDDNISVSGSSITPHKKDKWPLTGKRLFFALKRNSLLNLSHIHAPHYNRDMPPNNELLVIKRKLHNLKREQKAFRTVGLILGALLICWLPFFVILPIVSIQQHQNKNQVDAAENTWFKIAFWLGYCNSALNPFVYAFSNRAIRRAFRETIFRRCCFCCCTETSEQTDEQVRERRRQHGHSGSLLTDISMTMSRGPRSTSVDMDRIVAKMDKELDCASLRMPQIDAPVVSFAEMLAENDDDDDNQEPPVPPVPCSNVETER